MEKKPHKLLIELAEKEYKRCLQLGTPSVLRSENYINSQIRNKDEESAKAFFDLYASPQLKEYDTAVKEFEQKIEAEYVKIKGNVMDVSKDFYNPIMPLGLPNRATDAYIFLPYITSEESNLEAGLTARLDRGSLFDTEQTIRTFRWVSELFKEEGYNLEFSRGDVYIDNAFKDDLGTKEKLSKFFEFVSEIQKSMN